MAQKGDRVVFRIAHAYLPEARDLLADLTDQAELEGVVTDFSDAGTEAQAFAIVRIYDRRVVVVPAEKLRVVTLSDPELTESESRGNS